MQQPRPALPQPRAVVGGTCGANDEEMGGQGAAAGTEGWRRLSKHRWSRPQLLQGLPVHGRDVGGVASWVASNGTRRLLVRQRLGPWVLAASLPQTRMVVQGPTTSAGKRWRGDSTQPAYEASTPEVHPSRPSRQVPQLCLSRASCGNLQAASTMSMVHGVSTRCASSRSSSDAGAVGHQPQRPICGARSSCSVWPADHGGS